MVRQGKLKHHDGSEVNEMAAKRSVNTSLQSLRDNPCSTNPDDPQDFALPKQSWEKLCYSTFAIINVTFYYSAMLASMYVSSTR